MLKTDQRSTPASKSTICLFLVIVLGITFFSHLPALQNEFTNWDDNWHIQQYFERFQLDRITVKSLTHVFTDFDSFDMYIPMIVLSWMVEYQIAGLSPFLYHLDNVIIHLISTALVFYLFYLLFQKLEIAVIVALMFGVSTINVESVAWISGRKDLLYAVFFLSSLTFYVRYRNHQKKSALFLSILFFLFSLLSKAQSAFLAPTLLLIDYVLGVSYIKPLKVVSVKKKNDIVKRSLWSRIEKNLLLEKIPYFALAFFFGCLAIYAVKYNPAYTKMQFSFFSKTVFASYGLTQYLIKSFIPYSLSAVYPYPVMEGNAIPASYYGFLFPAVIIVGIPVISFIRKKKIIAFGMAFAIVNIVALLQFFSNSNLIMGDHYTYISSLGYYFLFASGILYLIRLKPGWKIGIYALAALYLVSLSTLTFQRSAVWKDSLSLWDDVLKKHPRSMEALIKRGRAKIEIEDYTGALKDFEKAKVLHGDVHSIHQYIGICEEKLKRFPSAIENYHKDLKSNPNAVDSMRGLGRSFYGVKDYSQCIKAFTAVQKVLPLSQEAFQYSGMAKMKMNNATDAISDFSRLIELNPLHTLAYLLRGSAYFTLNRYKEALKDFDTTLKQNPNVTEAYYKRAVTNGTLEQFDAVIKDMNRLLDRSANEPFAYYLRGVAKLELKKNGCEDLKRAHGMGFAGALEKINASCQTK